MKTPLLSLFLVGTAILVFGSRPLLADDATPAAPAPGTTVGEGSAADGEQGQRMEKMKEALAQLNLTDAQKDQIKQIRANTTDKRSRRQQIMAVLTPDQKQKLIEMFKERRAAQTAN